MTFIFRQFMGSACVLTLCLLSACTSLLPPDPSVSVAKPDIDWVAVSQAERSSAKWTNWIFPGKNSTRYQAIWLDGRSAIESDSKSAASMLRQGLRVEAAELHKLRFSWKVPALIEGADLTQRETADSPVRVVLAFDGNRSTFSAKNSMLSELALAVTGEPLPYATLMYVWGNHRPVGSIITSSRTDRIRKLVLESGPSQLNRWLDYERDIRADYEKAFGEAPGALLAIGIMTDTDNTRSNTLAWYGPITLVPDTLAKK